LTKKRKSSYNKRVFNISKCGKEVDNMGKYCYCPTSFNVTMGLFMIFLACLAFFDIWEVFMPLWLTIVTLIMGILLIFLNSANPIHEKISADELSSEKANRIHAKEGY